MGDMQKLPNIGAVLEEQLADIGITTYEELKNTGSKQAWLKILARDPSACYNRLCGLEGAIQMIRWHDLAAETKAELKDFYRSVKGKK